MALRCFACGRAIVGEGRTVDTRDDQLVLVGPDCYRRVLAAGAEGYLPKSSPPGGVRLYPLREDARAHPNRRRTP